MQKDLFEDLANEVDIIANTMKVPKLKIAVEKFEKLYNENKQKAIAEHNECKQKLYAIEGTGQWSICRDLGNKGASPLIAVKRPKKSKAGKAKGQ